MTQYLTIAALVMTVLISGCASKEEEVAAQGITGTWISLCDPKSSYSEKMILVLNADGTMTQTEDKYSSLDCSGSVASSEVQYTGTYVVGADVDGMSGVKKLDLYRVPPVGTAYTYYTIFKLESDRFNWGKISGANDGFTEVNRHIELGTDEDDIYDRQ